MTIWIVEDGVYDDQIIVGVYATVEAAKAAHERDDWTYYANSESGLPAWVSKRGTLDVIAITQWEVK